MSELQYIWSDRKRHLGLPLSFTKYRLTEDRLFCEMGWLNLREEEILLYRVRDLELRMSLGQRLFGVGSVVVHSSDKTTPALELRSVKRPRQVKEQLHQLVEKRKEERRLRPVEMMDSCGCDHDGDDEETL